MRRSVRKIKWFKKTRGRYDVTLNRTMFCLAGDYRYNILCLIFINTPCNEYWNLTVSFTMKWNISVLSHLEINWNIIIPFCKI